MKARQSPMTRSTPLARGGFARRMPPKRPGKTVSDDFRVLPRTPAPAARLDGLCRPDPKVIPEDHGRYIALVRLMPCAHCRKPGPSQFCHSDEGKGTGTKTDCRYGWPGCADAPGLPGCHTLIGTLRIYPKHERRELESQLSKATRDDIFSRGLWPADLPRLPEDS